jgi:hypothetical protein
MSDCLTFAAGQVATLTAQFVTSPAGQPVDVPDATVEVFLGDNVIVEPSAMIHVITGFYFFDWLIPNSLTPNTYTVRYTGTVLGIPTAAISSIKILPPGTPTGVTQSQKAIEILAAFDSYIRCAQMIPVYNEVSRRNGARDTFQLTWPRWNLGNHAVFLNDEETLDSIIDFDTGTIRFEAPLLDSDRVVATYNFRMFSDIDKLRFITDAINFLNVEPPGTAHTIDSLPDTAVGIVLQGAAALAIKQLLMCLNFQEPATIFGGKEGAQQAHGNLMALKENYEKSFMELKKQFKRARWPNIAGVVQPEFTLPGGRSRWFRFLFSSSVF